MDFFESNDFIFSEITKLGDKTIDHRDDSYAEMLKRDADDEQAMQDYYDDKFPY